MTTPNTTLRDIWGLSWPQVLMMFFHFLIGFVDVWVAGRISSNVQAAMGMINQLMFFFLVVAIAVANGSVAAISQSLGAGLYKRIRRYVGLIVQLGVITGLLIFLIGLASTEVMLTILQVPPQLDDVTRYFFKVFMAVLPCYSLLILTNAVFRAQRRVIYPMYTMLLITVVNALGDLGLGLGWFGLPEIGYRGLAWSTFISVACGALFNLAVLWRLGLLQRQSFPPWRWSKRAMPYLFKVAWPGGLLHIVWHSAYMVLFAITASLPHDNVVALAGMTAGMRVEAFLFLPGFAFSMTASILVGQYLGMGRPDLARKNAYQALIVGITVMSTVAVLLWQVIEPVTAFLSPDAAVQAESVNYLIYNMLCIPFTLTGMILSGAMTGAGATLFNLLAFGTSSWLVRLPLAWYLGHVYFREATGVWLAMLISMAFQAAFILYLFQFHDWTRFAMKSRRNGRANASGVTNAA
jgi:MATE family multidrug resistance protein